MSGPSRIGEMISARVAARTARTLIPPGPDLPREDRDRIVAELRESAATATDLVLDVMRLPTEQADRSRARLVDAEILVVDRPSWARANVQSMIALLETPITKVLDERTGKGPRGSGRAAGAELGATLAFLSTRVLGQYDPFGVPGGRLMLVAPSITAVADRLEVDRTEFQLWVALHEETHRVQFATAPWLAEHLAGLIGDLVARMLGPRPTGERVETFLGGIRRMVQDPASSLLDVVQSPEERALTDQLTAVMSLLEGHADVVMDAVGPKVIPSIRTIRRAFDRRRHETSGFDGLIKRLIGLEQKAEQYRRGARFVRRVRGRAGAAGLNAVWSGPEALPTLSELDDPNAWIERVLG